MNSFLSKFQERVRENILLWSTVISLFVLAFYMEKISTPAKRPFSIDDPNISYPFTEIERYPENLMFLLCLVCPILVTSIFIFADQINNKFHRFYKTATSFAFAIVLTGFLTAFLKIRFAKLRPDFISRCGVDIDMIKLNNDNNVLYDERICTAPLGKTILNDGYKSCPSGHSSMSMCGMLFLSIWFYLTYGKKSGNGLVKLFCFTPLLISFDIITSRIYDFRHGYSDILLGTVIGAICTILSITHFKIPTSKESESNILPL